MVILIKNTVGGVTHIWSTVYYYSYACSNVSNKAWVVYAAESRILAPAPIAIKFVKSAVDIRHERTVASAHVAILRRRNFATLQYSDCDLCTWPLSRCPWICPVIPMYLISCTYFPLSPCPHVPLSPCPSVTMSLCHHVPMSPCPMSHCHQVPLSPSPTVTKSHCHQVPLSQCPCWQSPILIDIQTDKSKYTKNTVSI